MDFKACDHPTFQARTSVMRLTKVEGGPVTGYSADIHIRCSKCGMPFRFKGVPAGSSPDRPMASFLGDELRAPIEPAPHAEAWEEPAEMRRAERIAARRKKLRQFMDTPIAELARKNRDEPPENA